MKTAALLLASLLASPPLTTTAPALTAAPDPVTWSVAPATEQGGAKRASFGFEADPGRELRDSVVVTNFSGAQVTFKLYANDAVNTPTGGFDLLAGDKKPTDVGAWIRLAEDSVTIPAGGSATVPFTLTVPANGTPGDHTGGIVAALVPAGNGPVTVENRVGTRVYLRVHGALVPQLTVTSLTVRHHGRFNPFAGGDVTAQYTIRNTGNIRLSVGQGADVTSGTGNRLAGADGAAVPELLPGQSLTFDTRLTGVEPLGPITTNVRITPAAVTGDAYAESLSAAQLGTAQRSTGLWAVPWSQIVFLTLLAGLIWMAVEIYRRRRRAHARALADAVEQGRREATEESRIKESL
ncbi:hypothetical protein J2S43_005751 [Catenuloplanes nepalensis]|uniref:WxL Interacting Protein peptidoglycan binding domain-containing protein n=1 Tax=Catenuloplanes nepalensis TaxID=587533 RepID=A0ABT9N0P7_9ACTN|nr:DUF916 domain-containing protein [Catenuloplanes nepalensis]MDP9797239.1 hypothetical protein [Catenuloplanes nepalensis]